MKTERELYVYRRHLKTCQYFGPGGRDVRLDKCRCPFSVEGVYRGKRPRVSLKTTSHQTAERRLADVIRKIDAALDSNEKNPLATGSATASTEISLSEAVDRFLRRYGSVGSDGKYRGDSFSTFRKYRAGLRFLVSFCDRTGRRALASITVDVLENFRQSRALSPVAAKSEIQSLRTFFAFCVTRKWIGANPAKEVRAPKNIKPNDDGPYTLAEESRILAACEQIGGGKYNRSGARYEQLRAKAMILLLRHTALWISDVATLRKDSVSFDAGRGTWRVRLRTQKTGDHVYLPIPRDLKTLLDSLPLPRNAAMDCPCFFWNGETSRRAVVGIAERTLSAVFKKSGVRNAHAHRYRHTLATRLLGEGASFQEVADILGNTAEIVRKHYGKWSQGRQDSIDRLMMAHFQTALATNSVTPESHEKMGAVN